MTLKQPLITTAAGDRRFACSAAALLAFIVDEQERILMLAHPKREGAWEVINGALDAGESALDGALREIREEAGPHVRVRPLGAVHIGSFHYDENVHFMLSLSLLFAYEGGEVLPGDDMRGSRYRWWRLEELMAEEVNILTPPDQKWVFARAVELYRLWKDQRVELQPELGAPGTPKVK